MYGTRQRDIPTASAQTMFNQQLWREQTTDRHGMLDAYYVRSFGDTRLTLRGPRTTASPTPARIRCAVEPDGTPTAVGETAGLGARWSVSAGITQPLRFGQTLRAGIEFIDNMQPGSERDFVNDPVPLFDIDHSSTQQALYLQDEVKLGRWFIVNAGLRYDRYQQFDRVTPRAALIVLPSSVQSFKYLYGNAFRAPNEYELNAVYFGDAVYALRPEAIDTHEFVWERYINDRLRTSVSTYWYKADRLITTTLDDSAFLGVSFVNQGQVRAKGLELEAQMRLRGESQGAGQLRAAERGGSADPRRAAELAAPRRQGANQPARADAALVRVDRGTVLEQPRDPGPAGQRRLDGREPRGSGGEPRTSPSCSRLDAPGSCRAGSGTCSTPGTTDPVSDQHVQEAIEQNGRTARIGLTWKIGAVGASASATAVTAVRGRRARSAGTCARSPGSSRTETAHTPRA